ncbi:uncharacterized protein LOC143927856 isoform X2 [Lithobates pipiens]
MDRIFQHFAILALMCITRVVADVCAPYVGPDFSIHQGQTCSPFFCSGSCTNRYCSIIPGFQLDQSQFLCILNNLYFVIGVGIIISLLTVISIISCICKSLCLCCRLCERQPRATAMTTSVAVTSIAPQPLVTMPAAAGYRPVPHHSMYAQQADKANIPPPYPGADNFAYVD